MNKKSRRDCVQPERQKTRSHTNKKSMDFVLYGSNTAIGSTVCTAMGELRAGKTKDTIQPNKR